MRPPPGLPMVADADHDFEISAQEWEAFISALEPDDQGVLNPETFREFMRSHRPESRGDQPPPPPPPRERGEDRPPFPDRDHNGLFEVADLDAIFQDLDRNGDGVIQRDEMPRPPRRPRR